MTKRSISLSAGFSAIELLVTLFVASALVLAFYQLFAVIDEGNVHAKYTAIASDLASSNLSKYPKANSSPAGSIGSGTDNNNCSGSTSPCRVTCDATGTSGNNVNNLSIRPTAPGSRIFYSSGDQVNGLPGTVNEEVRAWWPKGCSEKLIKIESTVKYGSNPQRTIAQATYVGYE